MSTLVARLRAEVDEDVNEPLDQLLDEAAGRVEVLEMVLVEMLAKSRGGMRKRWCGCVDCHCVLPGRALRHGLSRTDRRQQTTRSTRRLSGRRAADN
jgi:hypothetical protein